MAAKQELADLTAEIAALREEVQRLREAQAGHACPVVTYYPQPYYPQPYYPQPYVAPMWVSQPYHVTCDIPTNLCAGVPSVQTYMVNTTCAGPAMIPAPVYTQGAAGCNPAVTTLMLNTGGAN